MPFGGPGIRRDVPATVALPQPQPQHADDGAGSHRDDAGDRQIDRPDSSTARCGGGAGTDRSSESWSRANSRHARLDGYRARSGRSSSTRRRRCPARRRWPRGVTAGARPGSTTPSTDRRRSSARRSRAGPPPRNPSAARRLAPSPASGPRTDCRRRRRRPPDRRRRRADGTPAVLRWATARRWPRRRSSPLTAMASSTDTATAARSSGGRASSRSSSVSSGYSTYIMMMPVPNQSANNAHIATPNQRCTRNSERLTRSFMAKNSRAFLHDGSAMRPVKFTVKRRQRCEAARTARTPRVTAARRPCAATRSAALTAVSGPLVPFDQ